MCIYKCKECTVNYKEVSRIYWKMYMYCITWRTHPIVKNIKVYGKYSNKSCAYLYSIACILKGLIYIKRKRKALSFLSLPNTASVHVCIYLPEEGGGLSDIQVTSWLKTPRCTGVCTVDLFGSIYT